MDTRFSVLVAGRTTAFVLFIPFNFLEYVSTTGQGLV